MDIDKWRRSVSEEFSTIFSLTASTASCLVMLNSQWYLNQLSPGDVSLTQCLTLFLPSCRCQWRFLFLSETKKKVYIRFQRFPQAIIQPGEREEEEETADNSVVKEEGAEQNVGQPSLDEPGQKEAQHVFLSLRVVCLLEDSRHRERELALLSLLSLYTPTQLVGGLHRHADGGWFQSSLLQETQCILKPLLAESSRNNLRKRQR